jgi:AcrR family transcriptional regulator
MTDKNKLFDNDRAGAIYRTAARMIYEQGFDATSMSQIADAVQLTKPGLYYYVKGKKELLFAIMGFAMDRLESEVVRPAEAIADPAERLRAIVAEHARLLTHEMGTLAILIDEVDGLSEVYREQIIARKRRYLNFVRATLDELREAGRLQPVDTTVAAFSMLGMVMWISRWYDGEGPLTGEDVVRDVTTIALGGLLRESALAEPGRSTQEIDKPHENPS